jgi:hypothetical protein
LETRRIIGPDGREHADLLELDSFLDAVLFAARACPGDWMHDEDVATPIDGGRLEVRAMCTTGH